MTRLVLVRHGESEWNAEGRFQGQGGSGLSDRGRREAAALAAHLPGRFPDTVLVAASDQQRVAETVAPTVERLGASVAVLVDPRLREMNVSAWSGRLLVDLAAEEGEALSAWRRGVDLPGSTSETFIDFRARVLGALEDAATKAGDATVLMFTHGGCLRTALGAVLDLPPSGQHRLVPAANASVTVLRDDGDGLRLATYNETAHLT